MSCTTSETPVATTPRFCPWCGGVDTLKECSVSGPWVESGCWNGKRYCYEGDTQPGYSCSVCERVFSVGIDEEDIHDDCSCVTGDCEDGKDCPHYKRASANNAASTDARKEDE